MKKSKIIVFLLLFVLVFIAFRNFCFGYNLELILSSDKSDVKVGDIVNITLTISKGMQAADFTINYDSELLEFNSASIGKNFYNANEPGKVVCSWFDTNDTKDFKFTFSAKKEGIAIFSTTTENFYDGDLKSATSYKEGVLNVKLLSSSSSIQDSSTTQNNLKTQNVQITSSNNNITTNQSNSNISQIDNVSKDTLIKSDTSNIISSSNNINFIKSSDTLPQTGDNTFVFIVFGILFISVAVFAKFKFNTLKDI